MSQDKEKIKEIEKRISLLKGKDKQRNGGLRDDLLSVGLQVSVELVSGVIVGFCVGYTLNEVFDFGPVFLICMTILGGFAGFFNVARYLKQIEKSKEDK